ncbi:MAG TPA: hypothetical protein VJ722_00315 [Rhodanobacteraceae bacterium]|nr:hypothetical protein [Rhodanobacteraceae bacterium]
MSYSLKSKAADSSSRMLAKSDSSADRAWEKGDFSDWMELMEAVEALCPVWPKPQAAREDQAVYKL